MRDWTWSLADRLSFVVGELTSLVDDLNLPRYIRDDIAQFEVSVDRDVFAPIDERNDALGADVYRLRTPPGQMPTSSRNYLEKLCGEITDLVEELGPKVPEAMRVEWAALEKEVLN